MRDADVNGRRHFRLVNTVPLVVPSTPHSTLGKNAFPVAMARIWFIADDQVPNITTNITKGAKSHLWLKIALHIGKRVVPTFYF